MTVDWTALDAELALWRAEGLHLPIWWRDDDAIAPTPALDRLAALAEDLSLPVHIAVIPRHAEPALAAYSKDRPLIRPLVHGWQHISHAPDGAKKAEFGHPRPDAAHELAQALNRMQQLFGDDLLPIFVPPWNRLDDGLLPVLADAGYVGVSTYLPRNNRIAAPGLVQINTHIDPIFWRGTRSLVPPDTLIADITKLLQDRRKGLTDPQEPLGFLTHHLVHDEDIWGFTHACLARLLDGGAVPSQMTELP
ncbi:polysaccharide deacetylase family protein [Sulfitobacter pontiacus]|uniref:polysaccharide deacetylase family protein n=1 Tax=Sulfitobacter pontiacus TaxID=60137 RepID=UPI0030EBC9CC